MGTSRVYCLCVTLVLLAAFQCADTGFDKMDPNGNITIKWDVVEWTGDGYRTIVTMYNYQMNRHIQSPGWIMGWSWSKMEVIWNLIGAKTRDQGDCSKYKGSLPHCCSRKPDVIDLLPGEPYQIVVGNTGNTNTTIQLPKNFTLMTPGPGYTCSKAYLVPKTKFMTPDGRRTTQAFRSITMVSKGINGGHFLLASVVVVLSPLIFLGAQLCTVAY